MGLTWNLAPPHAQKTDGCLAHKGLSAVPTKNFFFFFMLLPWTLSAPITEQHILLQ